MMNKSEYEYVVGLKDNKQTNEFLRCLWSRLAAKFGKLAWYYSPQRQDKSIDVGQACLGNGVLIYIKLHYKKKGCLNCIDFDPHGTFDQVNLKEQLRQCVNEALHYDKYIIQKVYKGKLDKNLSFVEKTTDSFVVKGNSISLKVSGYDDQDCTSMFKAQLQQVCNFLTYDTLKYITIGGTLTEEIRSNHNYTTRLINGNTEEVMDTFDKNAMYRNLVVSDQMAEYVNSYLQRSYGYDEHYTNFEKSVHFFAQGVRNEEYSKLAIGLPEPFAEQAIVNYMSALEVITIYDKKPEQCECCKQLKYSIARRVIDLAEQALPDGGTFARKYYDARSQYLHTGTLFSSNNYVGRYIPLMSKNTTSKMLDQVAIIDGGLKGIVKACIEWHESHPKAQTSKSDVEKDATSLIGYIRILIESIKRF